MYWLNHYVVDWSKVQTLEDMKRIMEAVHFAFEPDSPSLKNIKDLVREEPKSSHSR